jgi:hypothetical protein
MVLESLGKFGATLGKHGREPLSRLGRDDLMSLLLDSLRESDELRRELSEASERCEELRLVADSLRRCLDEKDARIEMLERRLGDAVGRACVAPESSDGASSGSDESRASFVEDVS